MTRAAGRAARSRDGRPDPMAARLAADTRERFLREVAARVPLDRVVTLHLFAPLRQGGVESGVAVLAVRHEEPVAPVAPDGEALPAGEGPARCDPTDAAAGAPPSALPATVGAAPRHTVVTASYHLALKGAERGRWTFELREEADAPLLSLDAVVRGVHDRAGDAAEVERLDAPALRQLLGVRAAGEADGAAGGGLG